ncbi:MAG: galactokinase, partial [Gemmatimonadetes bacterium]|nr:galactokinase [Gemmatimonadota bacterium]
MGFSWEDEGLSDLIGTFREAFPEGSPDLISRAPGRVNLIGEHTDYNGLPVFPMALRKEIRIILSPRKDALIRAVNQEGEFGLREFTISGDIPAHPAGDWANYLQAPCQALARQFGGLSGFDALVSSTLPVASGLSSSSALVIAMGQALLRVNELTLPTLDFAEAMAAAERYTGTQGGGMDQAISAGAVEGHASRIEFAPLRMFETPVPEDWRFVVAHTLVRAEKSGMAQEGYNARTRECREALEIVADAALAQGQAPEGTDSYPLLLERVCIQDLVELGEAYLEGTLLKRFRHVVTEGSRVYDAEHAMARGDRSTFGLLVNASHRSLQEDYEVSSPELDALVELALGAGASGARLTGAGFGGCIVALAGPDSLDRVMSALENGYYRPRGVLGALDGV